MENLTATPAQHLAVLQKQGKLIVHDYRPKPDHITLYKDYKLNRVVKKLCYFGSKGYVRMLVDGAGNRFFSDEGLAIRGDVPRGHFCHQNDTTSKPRSIECLIPHEKVIARWDTKWPVAVSKHEDAGFVWFNGGIPVREQAYKWICKMHGRDLTWKFNGLPADKKGLFIIQDSHADIVALLKPILVLPDGKIAATETYVKQIQGI